MTHLPTPLKNYKVLLCLVFLNQLSCRVIWSNVTNESS